MAKKDEGTTSARRIGKTKYNNLLAHARRSRKHVAETNGEYREAVGRAVENENLDKRAHGMITKLDKLEPEDLRRTMDEFEYLYDISGLRERAESVQPMEFEPAEGDEAGAEDVRPRTAKQREKDRAGDGKVARPFPTPGTVAAE